MADMSNPAETVEIEKTDTTSAEKQQEEEKIEDSLEVSNNSGSEDKIEPVETSPDVSKSRYGRARKPKITEDYYNIEDIFCPYERITSSSPRRKQKSEQSPKKDGLSIDIKSVEIKPVDINSILSMNISEVSAEMSKVMKIVTNNDYSPKSPIKPIKTYGNKKKILESHEYLNGAKFSDSEVRNSDESNDSLNFKRTKKYTKKSSASASKDENLDTNIFKKNKQLKKLQKDLNIDGFKEGRLRSSITDSSNEEEKEVDVVEKQKLLKPFVLDDTEENIALLEAEASYTPKIGDLSWSRVGSYPFWPSIVTPEPTTKRHCKVTSFGRRHVLCYHVHFFGDNGRRSWVYGTHIFPFNRRSDLEVMAQSVCRDSRPKDPKHLSAYIINPNKLKKWELAVTEAENLTQHSPEIRIQKFFRLVGPKVKNNVSVDKTKLEGKIKIKKYKKKLKDMKNELEKEKRKIDDSKTVSEDSFSESDISVTVKQEIRDTPSPQQLTSIQRLKRINLFKGITKDRACQICGKNKQVYKCKGTCFGLYHIECDKKVRLKLLNREGDTYSDSDSEEEEIGKKKIKRRNSSTSEKSIKSEIKDEKIEETETESIKEEKEKEDCQIEEKAEKEEICNNILTDILDKVFEQTEDKLEDKLEEKPEDKLEEKLEEKEEKEDKKSKTITLSMAEQIDLKMQEIMQNLITETKYTDSTTDEETDVEKSSNFEEYAHLPFFEEEIPDSKPKVRKTFIKHVTADGIFDVIEEEEINNEETFRCAYCSTGVKPPCFICNKYEAKSGDRKRHKCFTHQCGKYFHSECLTDWPQTKWNVSSKSKKIENETLCCPYHNCHTCISDNPREPLSRYTNEKLAKCIRCPTTYHSSPFCIPAGTEILSAYQLICPKHLSNSNEDDSSLFSLPSHLIPHSSNSNSTQHPTAQNPSSHNSNSNSNPTSKNPNSHNSNKHPTGQNPNSHNSNGNKNPTTHNPNSKNPTSNNPNSHNHSPKRKVQKSKIMPHVNASWCFICSTGGSLICCETCPSAFHEECLKLVPPEGRYLCEECESGRLPLYDEIVWVKLGAYRWWPAQILFPADVPANVASMPHSVGEFVVRFFGSHDHYWVNRGRVFLFQEGDTGHASSKKSAVDGLFVKAIHEATRAHKRFIEDRASRLAEARNGMRPPPYVKIKVNRPVGNVRTNDADTSNTTPCDCNPNWEEPCGPDSDCLNRILMTECNPLVCAAGSRCCNQSFEKRLYAPVTPFKTSGRGWGLKTLAPVKKGSFVIEYVGELIDEKEYHRRMKRKHEQKDENYYFLTIDKDRMIDAGPKGNVARFMNHSCAPNCETQKWTVNGDTRVGLFAITDIPSGAELTFNYNLECIGEEKKECRCGAGNCSGFIGAKAKQDEPTKKRKSLPVKSKKKKPPTETKTEVVCCFVCGEPEAIQPCDREACNKYYHWGCVGLETFQEGKWYCPWHSCNICTKRTTRCCYMCINSYCPIHSEGNIRYDRVKGFVCTTHDIKEEEESKEETEDQKTKEKLKKTKKQIRNSMDIRSSTDSSKNTEDVDNIEADVEETDENSKEETINEDKKSKTKKAKKEVKTSEENPVIEEAKKEEVIEEIKVEENEKKEEQIEEKPKEAKVFKEVKNGAFESSKSKVEEVIQPEETKTEKEETLESPKNEEKPKEAVEEKQKTNSIKKRKSRLSLKQNTSISTSNSSQESSDEDKPLSAVKKIKLDEAKLEEAKQEVKEEPTKVLRSNRSSSQDNESSKLEIKKKRSLSLTDIDNSSASEADFVVSPKIFVAKRGRPPKKRKLTKNLRSSLQNSSDIKEDKEKLTFEDKDLQTSVKKKKLELKKKPNSKIEDLDQKEELILGDSILKKSKTPKSEEKKKHNKFENPKPGTRRSGRYLKQDDTTDEETEDKKEDVIEISSSEDTDLDKQNKRKSLRSHKLEDSDDNMDYEDTPKEETLKRKRGRPRKYPKQVEIPLKQKSRKSLLTELTQKVEQATEIYKMKLNEIPKFENHVKEVKLTANVPERHLRVVLRKSEIETKIENKIENKFIKMQNDIERDLPIRKRSKLRYETQL